MAYLGRQPTIGNFQVCDAISVVNGQAAYTMQVGGVNVSPESSYHMIVSLNGVIQNPKNSFTVASSTITFASNLVTGDVIDFIQILGNVLDLGVPSDATVSTAKIVDANVTTAKIADTSVTPAKLNLNDNLLFNTASKGIYLGTTSATASNLLDDYEEGGWTPTAIGSTTAGTSPTGNGRYTKIGNLVHVDFSFVNMTIGSAAGDLRITGLPFTISGAEGCRGSFGGNLRLLNYDTAGNTYYQLTVVADQDQTYLIVTQTRDNGNWDTLDVVSGANIYIEGGITYTTTA